MKKIVKVLIPAALLSCAFTTSHAATSDGKSFSVSAGWLHIMPQGKTQGVSGSLNVTSTPVPINSPTAGFEIKDADTAALLFDYYVNDNVSLELVTGVPPKMEIDGKGTILKGISAANAGAGVDLSSLGDIGKVKAYTPALIGKYQFGTVESKFRPFVGAGIMYAHFSGFKLGSNVDSSLNSQVGASQLGLSVNKVKIDDAVAPVAVIGADFNINKDWFVTGSVTYAHLKTRAKLDIGSSTYGNSEFIQGESDIEINPIVTYLGIGYRF
ncbi:OmpW/AlkL family protein [Acinetobacter sp. MD2]|uniref:OmpW/AlkL family protein n=1 Tax=Acinetobacter sp. MD2 TaxID=2600066 RepID=UPI002D1EC022|nr:OmpW family outer membrane protein [Acinetobacter sp. MD2]MEB3766181.1 OmpW family protein [Acinetobacter sp. MD2]